MSATLLAPMLNEIAFVPQPAYFGMCRSQGHERVPTFRIRSRHLAEDVLGLVALVDFRRRLRR